MNGKIFLSLFMLVLMIPISHATAHSKSMVTVESKVMGFKQTNLTQKQLMVKKLITEVWSEGKLSEVNQLIAERYKIFFDSGDPWEGETLDHEAYKKRVMLSRKVFPDLNFKINQIYESDGKVIVSWFMRGTNKGDLPELPATNKKVNVPGITIYYFDHNKISGHWQVTDRLVLFNNLGITHF